LKSIVALFHFFLLLSIFLSATTNNKQMIDTNKYFMTKCYQITPLCSSCFQW